MVSVVMVSFNQKEFISGAVESLLGQNCSDWLLFMVDDHSTDGSPEVIDFYRKSYPDKIRHVFSEEMGIIAAYRAGINAALAEAKTDCIAFLEAADRWSPDNLAKKCQVLEEHPGAGVVYSDVELVGEPGIIAAKQSYLRMVRSVPRGEPFDISTRILYSNPVPTFSCVMARKGLLSELSYPGEDEQYWMDWSLWNQLAFRTKFYFLPERLVQWRHHSASAYTQLRFIGGQAALKRLEMRQRLRFLARAMRSKDTGFPRKLGLFSGFFFGMLATLVRYGESLGSSLCLEYNRTTVLKTNKKKNE